MPHVLAVLDAVDHFQKDLFLLLNSSCFFSQSFHPELQLVQQATLEVRGVTEVALFGLGADLCLAMWA